MPEVRIRATTFQIRYRGAVLTSRQWDAEIRRAIRAANEIYSSAIFGRDRIHFTVSNTVHLSEEASMTLLTQSARRESQVEGIPYTAYFERERRLDAYNQQAASGARGPFDYGGFLVRAFPLDASQATEMSRRTASREALDILRLNRRSGEVSTYWVPGFNSGYHGLTYLPEFNPGVGPNEGIFISYQAARDILAHELGHLLMRAGHCTFEGPNGTAEGSAPPANLMHRDNESRTGTDLTAGQVQRILASGTTYFH
jgi:hypothetical protein